MNGILLNVNGYLTLIDLVVVAGAAVVLPVALGRWTGAWLVVAASTAMALSVDPGPAGLAWSLPWAVVAAAATVSAGIPVLRRSIPAGWGPLRPPTLDGVASVAAPAFALVAGTGLVESCGDLGAFGFGEPITRLAAVHFTFAGAATTALGRAARRAAADGSPRRRQVATAGLVLALVAPPVVGLGFFSEAALPQVGGAVLMAASAYLIAGCHLAEAWPARRTRVGRLLAVSGRLGPERLGADGAGGRLGPGPAHRWPGPLDPRHGPHPRLAQRLRVRRLRPGRPLVGDPPGTGDDGDRADRRPG